jgi:hypothetical protein
MNTKKYKMRVIRGAFVEPSKLEKLGAKVIEKLDRSEWQSIDEVEVSLEQIKELQKDMIWHYDDIVVPWYMDGYAVANKSDLIVAFGIDDGEGGRVFQFSRNNKKSINKVVEYGIEKGILKEQMDFMDIDF